MPDIPNRDELEARLARLFGRLSREHMHRWLEELGDPPRLENASPEIWDEMGKELRDAIRPFLEGVYLESAQRLMSEQPIGVDWLLVNEAAADWASTYTYRLVGEIDATTQQHLQASVSRYYRDGLTMGELEAQIGRMFSPVRAELIAITEVTRAAVEGERAIAAEVQAAGIQMEEVWQTNNDDKVCTICLPRHNKPEGDGWTKRDGPPAHPRCRCWTNHRVVTPEAPDA